MKHSHFLLFCTMLTSVPLSACAQVEPISLPLADTPTVAAFVKLNARLQAAQTLTYVSTLAVRQPEIDPKKQRFSFGVTPKEGGHVQTSTSSGVVGITQAQFTVHGFLQKPDKARFEVYQGSRLVRLVVTDGKTYADVAPALGRYRSGKEPGDPFGPNTPAASVLLTATMFMTGDVQSYYFPSPLSRMPLTASRSQLGGKSAWKIVCGGASLPPDKKDMGAGFAAQLYLDTETGLPLQLERTLADLYSQSPPRRGGPPPLLSLIRDTYARFDLEAGSLPASLFTWRPGKGMKLDPGLDQKQERK